MDLAVMPEFDGYKYFLVMIDVFSKHLYARPLKDKTASTVGKAFEDIYKEFQSPIFKLESDQVIFFNTCFKAKVFSFSTNYLYTVLMLPLSKN